MLHQLAASIGPPADGRVSAELEITPDLCSPSGDLRAGVLATLVDVIGGRLAVQAAAPDWVATADMSLHVVGPLRSGTVKAHGWVVRRGRTAVVIDVDIDDTAGLRVGSATMSFTVLPRRDTNLHVGDLPAGPTRWGASRRAGVDYFDFVGLTVVDNASGVVEIACAPHVANSFQALQGGMVCTVADLAANTAGAWALGTAATTTALETWFLAPAKVGPVRSSVEVLRSGPAGAVVRVELHDVGADGPDGPGGRLVTTALATVTPVQGPS
jgi:uncharacterized protein (TIGR00369 family)